MSGHVQSRIDARISKLEKNACPNGNDLHRIKSKREDNIYVLVARKVSWPQKKYIGSATKQWPSYDHLTLTQVIQGYTCNFLDEQD